MSSTLRRAWLLTNIVVTVALLPLLFPDRDSGSGAAVVAGAGTFETRPVALTEAPPSTILVPTTTTTAAPTTTTTAPPVTVKAAAAPTTTTTVKPKPKPTTTTTTAAPAPAAAPSGNSESGRATWYDYKPGICAHKTLPFGTVVTVNAVNGKSVQCTVGDRGPFVEGYIIDLHYREFEQLAPRSAGRIDVTITW